jgi:hypothetical protein
MQHGDIYEAIRWKEKLSRIAKPTGQIDEILLKQALLLC